MVPAPPPPPVAKGGGNTTRVTLYVTHSSGGGWPRLLLLLAPTASAMDHVAVHPVASDHDGAEGDDDDDGGILTTTLKRCEFVVSLLVISTAKRRATIVTAATAAPRISSSIIAAANCVAAAAVVAIERLTTAVRTSPGRTDCSGSCCWSSGTTRTSNCHALVMWVREMVSDEVTRAVNVSSPGRDKDAERDGVAAGVMLRPKGDLDGDRVTSVGDELSDGCDSVFVLVWLPCEL